MQLSCDNTLVVIPAYNEGHTIGGVVRDVLRLGFKCLVVSDGSTDQTSERAFDQGAVVVNLPINLGVGGALRCGFRFALEQGYQAVIQVDADGQHNVDDVQHLISAANNDPADMVIGSRFGALDSFKARSKSRLVMMKILALTINSVSDVRITDSTSGFRLIRYQLLTQLASNMPSYYLGDTFETLWATLRAGYRVSEIETKMASRQFGESSVSSSKCIWILTKIAAQTALGMGFKIENQTEVKAH